MSYGPPIEVLEDWNERLEACGCCALTVFFPPLADCQEKISVACGQPKVDGDCEQYRKIETQNFFPAYRLYGGELTHWGTLTHQFSKDANGDCDGGALTNSGTFSEVYIYTETGDDGSDPSWDEWSLVITQTQITSWDVPDFYSINIVWSGAGDGVDEEFKSGSYYADSTMDPQPEMPFVPSHADYAASVTNDYSSTGDGETQPAVFSQLVTIPQMIDELALVPAYQSPTLPWSSTGPCVAVSLCGLVRSVQIRWKIAGELLESEPFTGTHFQITWDVLEEPEEYDPEGEIDTRYLVEEGKTVAWEGPGNLLDLNDESWFTNWTEMMPPSILGKRYVVNARYTGYTTTPWGDPPPQVFGEAFTPREPAAEFFNPANSELYPLFF